MWWTFCSLFEWKCLNACKWICQMILLQVDTCNWWMRVYTIIFKFSLLACKHTYFFIKHNFIFLTKMWSKNSFPFETALQEKKIEHDFCTSTTLFLHLRITFSTEFQVSQYAFKIQCVLLHLVIQKFEVFQYSWWQIKCHLTRYFQELILSHFVYFLSPLLVNWHNEQCVVTEHNLQDKVFQLRIKNVHFSQSIYLPKNTKTCTATQRKTSQYDLNNEATSLNFYSLSLKEKIKRKISTTVHVYIPSAKRYLHIFPSDILCSDLLLTNRFSY